MHAAKSSTTWARSTMRRMPKKNDRRFATSMPCGKNPSSCRMGGSSEGRRGGVSFTDYCFSVSFCVLCGMALA